MQKKYKKIISWNVNGVRAAVRKGFLDWMHEEDPDIVCIQETKAHIDQLNDEIIKPAGYAGVWNQAERKGYSGVATFLKNKPISTRVKFGERLLDEEGRIVMTEHREFYLFNVYFPNGGRDSDRLKYKLKFYDRFLQLINEYRKIKPVIFCGDINTAHHEIDLARPKANEKNSGFMPIERKWLDTLEKQDFIDSFRYFYPDSEGSYSWWDMKTRSRERNVGWRLDYFWIDKIMINKVKDSFISNQTIGSDHCPVGIEINLDL